MSGRLARIVLLALCAAAPCAAASTPDEIEARRLDYLLARIEKEASELQVSQAVARQHVLDAGPQLSRRTCEKLASQMGSADQFKFLRDKVKQLEAKKSQKLLDNEQQERVAAVKKRVARLQEDSSMDCKALAPVNP